MVPRHSTCFLGWICTRDTRQILHGLSHRQLRVDMIYVDHGISVDLSICMTEVQKLH